jgi:hypothetical protein
MHSSSPHYCYMLCPSHPPEAPHYAVSPTSCHFIPLCSKYYAQHQVLKHPQIMFHTHAEPQAKLYTCIF